MSVPDIVTTYGYARTTTGVRCVACGVEFRAADGAVMRSHARNCLVNPRAFRVPGVCNA